MSTAVVSYALLPMAPPRLVPDIGIADTVGLAAGHDTGSTATGNHYFLDSAAGVVVVACALVAIRQFNRKER